MKSFEKTAIYLDAEDHRRLKRMALAQGRSTADLVRDAVSEFVQRQPRTTGPRALVETTGEESAKQELRSLGSFG
jgi:predicted transcriptional regulator